MKNFQNNFEISGFVGYTEVKNFDKTSVCRFSLNVSKNKDSERVSAFMNVEAWKKNEEAEEAFKTLEKGNLVTIEGYFKPEEWTDKEGKKQNRVVLVANKFYPIEDK